MPLLWTKWLITYCEFKKWEIIVPKLGGCPETNADGQITRPFGTGIKPVQPTANAKVGLSSVTWRKPLSARAVAMANYLRMPEL